MVAPVVSKPELSAGMPISSASQRRHVSSITTGAWLAARHMCVQARGKHVGQHGQRRAGAAYPSPRPRMTVADRVWEPDAPSACDRPLPPAGPGAEAAR